MTEEDDKVLISQIGRINAWYALCHPQFIDLVGDYAGRELFLLEGDALLRECFADERIDFRDGFQILHAIYVVERFLENLIKRHCRFHIAFFDEHIDLCIPATVPEALRPRYRLARSIAVQHLQLHLSELHDIQVHVFESFDSNAFDDYLSVSPIHFVMAHDGATSSASSIEEESTFDKRAKLLLRDLIRCFTAKRLNIALINCIEFRDSKIFTMVLESENAAIRASKLDLESRVSPYTSRDAHVLRKPVLSAIKPAGVEIEISQFMDRHDNAELNNDMPEQWRLTACVISALLSQDRNVMFSSAFVLHTVLLKHLKLSQRRFSLITFDTDLEISLINFLTDFADTAQAFLASREWTNAVRESDARRDLIDLVDGRLFRVVLNAMLESSLVSSLPYDVKDDWYTLSGVVLAMSAKSLSLDRETKGRLHNYKQESHTIENSTKMAVMPFSNSVLDKHLACIQVIADDPLPARLSMKLYRETTHWHNLKPLVVKKAPTVAVSKWKNPLRLNQFYMAEMTAYAASLTGAKGKVLEPETVTVGVRHLSKEPAALLVSLKQKSNEEKLSQKGKSSPTSEESSSNKKAGKKAVTGMKNAEKIIADNMRKKDGAKSNKAFSDWIVVIKSLDEIPDHQERYLRAKTYLDGLDTLKSIHIEAEVNLYLLDALLAWWAQYCKAGKKNEGYHVVAQIWTLARATCTSKGITRGITQHVRKICTILSITDAMSVPAADLPDRELSFVFKYPANSESLKIGLSQVEFQLLHVGPYMDRQLDAQPDPRVSSFTPDGWQRKVLDEIDANRSVFVVAPTSAGKTFISFYAMEQILRADNDSVLVYVAPTKALVNQIAAEIQGRFSKKFLRGGKSVWAIHTREYRVNNATSCQILVTVPHILQIMLLAPTNAQSWAPRVKRIIFDEIHSIGQAEDGVVWEQLLLLAPCPIIALSATVGNPTEFSDWLADTQKALGNKLTMIQHSTRYSDLRKYLYRPPTRFNFEGLGKSQNSHLSLDGLDGLTYFHPVASLIDRSRGMPNDLALEPRDCLLLWKAMCKSQTKEYPVPVRLDPTKNLPSCIRKVDIFKWENELKELLLQWMVAERTSPFDKVIQDLTPNSSFLGEEGFKVEVEEDAASSPGEESSDDSTLDESESVQLNGLRSTTMPLLHQLHKRGALPAILFHYDRSGCENIASGLLAQLISAENRWKEGKEWQRKLNDWSKWKELREKRILKKPAKAVKGKGNNDEERLSKTDQVRDEASSDISSFDLFDPLEPLDNFSFADKRNCQKSDLNIYIGQLRRRFVKEDFIALLQRGIGVHHAGMNRKYRQCVEMLFRKGYLRVVVATGTLSLGINMPCATVIFSGDSVYLTALNFRQAAGRAGRRGFDLLGNVVFQGVSTERACRLLSSRLPDLTGHFPITTTLVLRLFTLLSDSKYAPYAVKAVNSLLSQPRLYLGGESFKEQVLHHLRFSIEYLRRQGLLGPSGEPVNFTSCVSHLYFTENSSFAFHALLKDGYFKKLCADIKTKTDQVLRTMMLVLSHLFGRKVRREADDETTIETIRRSPSIVYLPPMPEEATAILREHNANTLSIFTTYVKTFSEQHISVEERVLPLSGVSIGRAQDATHEDIILNGTTNTNGHLNGNIHSTTKNGPVVAPFAFLPTLPVPQARSAFFGLSGHGDDFLTINDLCTSARSGIFLESAVIPHLEIHPDESRTLLNAYLLDFFMHGSVQPLEVANGIRRGDVWFVLNDFSLVLATIVTSLAGFLGLGTGDVNEEILEVMGSGDAAENDDDELAAEATIPTVTTSTLPDSSTLASSTHGNKKKKVADDWDAEEDAMTTNENLAEKINPVKAVTDDEEYEAMVNVYRAFVKLKVEFDAKFKLIWA